MLGGKKTKLFWCGVFVTVLGALSLFATVSNAIVGYQNYQNYFNAYSHQIPATVNTAAYLNNILIRAFVYVAFYIVLVSVGVYVAKMGLKTHEQQTASADQTAPA